MRIWCIKIGIVLVLHKYMYINHNVSKMNKTFRESHIKTWKNYFLIVAPPYPSHDFNEMSLLFVRKVFQKCKFYFSGSVLLEMIFFLKYIYLKWLPLNYMYGPILRPWAIILATLPLWPCPTSRRHDLNKLSLALWQKISIWIRNVLAQCFIRFFLFKTKSYKNGFPIVT
jgi:hypothetical protein